MVLYVDVIGTTSDQVGTTSDQAGEGTAREVAGRLGYSRCTYVKDYSGADNGYSSSETYLLRR